MAGPVKQAGQSARDLAKKIAQQMREEPLEVLKTAGSQVTGAESAEISQEGAPQDAGSEEQAKKIEEQKQAQDTAKSQRLYEGLKRELTDIEHQSVFSKLQAKIAQGETVPLEDFPELTEEQRKALLAQMEMVKKQNEAAQTQAAEAPPAVSSKPSRRMGSTRKQEAEKQQQRVEKPVPPSG